MAAFLLLPNIELAECRGSVTAGGSPWTIDALGIFLWRENP